MVKSLRFGSALTALGLIGAVTACATPGNHKARSASIFGDKVDKSNIGLATRAQLALEKGDMATAVPLAERAVAGSPSDAGFRTLLGNTYFAAGRFASAEAAYRDSLSLLAHQPQAVLRLALVSIAQGKNNAALALLESARGVLDPSDHGLALALAGQPAAAVAVLEQAARAVGADSRARQNLALAHALQGDWTMARAIAAQDVPADQVDARVRQWMSFAKPIKASDQVASLTGITPAVSDPGQPVRLALVSSPNRLAAYAPVVQIAEPAPVLVEEVAVAPPFVAAATAAAPAPIVEVVQMPEAAPAPVAIAAPEPVVAAAAPVAAAKPAPKPVAAKAAPKPALSPRAASFADGRPLLRRAAFPRATRGNSKAVVQLGAYAVRSFVGVAWNNISKKYPALRGYSPATARFESAKGTVYRLSVQGFASDGQARDFCAALKRAGGNCFVRTIAGDAPVKLASR